MTFSDDYRILLSPTGVPDGLDKLIVPERKLLLPAGAHQRAHAPNLAWHRDVASNTGTSKGAIRTYLQQHRLWS